MKRLIFVLIVLCIGTIRLLGDDHVTVTTNAEWTPLEREIDGISMVFVPAGCFMMGSTPEQIETAYASFVEQFGEDADVLHALQTEMPQHEQCFSTPFWMDKYPVRQADFVRLGGKRSTGNNFIGDNLPVETISWYESQGFCDLRGGRLPTEAEWEYATRGPDNLIYSWGNDWDETQLVWNRAETQGPAEVGSIETGASWVGAYDLIGNEWEWTSTIYSDDYPYPYISNDGRDNLERTTDKRVLRGGAWSSITLMGFRAAYRTASRPHSRYYSLGFRCVMDE